MNNVLNFLKTRVFDSKHASKLRVKMINNSHYHKLEPNDNSKSLGSPPDTDEEMMTFQKAPSFFIIHLALIISQVSFGGGSVVASLAMPDTNPALFAFIQWGFSSPLLCFAAYLLDRRMPSCKDWKLFIPPGLSLFVSQFTMIIGLKISSGILASSWQPSQGILAVMYGWCFGIEKHADAFKIMGILIGTGGALFMIIYDNQETPANTDLWHTFGGSAMFFCNCSATVFYLILGRPALSKYPSSTITACAYIISTCSGFVVSLIVASSQPILHFLCNDCRGAWEVPTVAIYALAYWIIMQSISYLLMTWANRYADPSVNLAYTVLQPFTVTFVSELLILFNVVPDCSTLPSDVDKSCLYGPSLSDLGAIGICIGLYFVIYSDRKKRAKQKAFIDNLGDVQQL
eukprot:1133383_1